MSKRESPTTPPPEPAALQQTPSVAPAEPTPLERMVDAWFIETFHNRGLDTPEFNRLSAARDRLKVLLAAAAQE